MTYYNILTLDSQEFVDEYKEILYETIDNLIRIDIKDLKLNDIENNEAFYLISKDWWNKYKDYLHGLNDIRDNPEDFKNFLFTGFDVGSLITNFVELNEENQGLSYIGPVNNFWLLNFYDAWEDNAWDKVYTNNYIRNIREEDEEESESKKTKDKKEFLIDERQYIKVNEDTWKLWINNFKCTNEIKRYKRCNEFEINLLEIRVIILDPQLKKTCWHLIKERYIQFSKHETIQEVINKVQRCVEHETKNKINFNNAKVFWIEREEYRRSDFIKLFLTYLIDIQSYHMHCQQINKDLDNTQTFELIQNHSIIIIDNHPGEYIVPVEKARGVCSYCNNSWTTNRYLQCDNPDCLDINDNAYYYCSDNCKQSDREHIKYHNHLNEMKTRSISIKEIINQDFTLILKGSKYDTNNTKEIKHGLTGLQNWGNTCFLNSALQCWSNCEEWTKYFLSNQFEVEINTQNNYGTRGEVATAYYNWLSKIWTGSEDYLSPSNFRHIFVHFTKQFSGYSQQDSHEVLTFMWDKWHEDLNRITTKPYIEMKSQEDNETEDAASLRFWKNYKKRENSMIVDWFHGQYKSRIICPECNKISITYDPFIFLSLPIPSGRFDIKVKYFPLWSQTQEEENLFIEYEILITENFTIEEYITNIALMSKIKNKTPTRQIEVVMFDKAKNIVKVFTTNEYLFAYFTKGYEICAYEKIKDASNLYCYPCYYDIKYWFFNIIPYEAVDILTYPIAISIADSEAISDIYEKISSIIIKKICLKEKKNHNTKSSEEMKSLVKSHTKITLENEHWLNYLIFLNRNNSNKTGNCEFCGHYCSYTSAWCGQGHSCRWLSRFDLSYKISYWKTMFTHKNIPIVLNVSLLNKINPNYNHWNHFAHSRPMMVMSRKNEINLYDCFNLFRAEEKWGEDNKWFCNRCKKHQEAFKKMDIYKPPYYWIVQLKRFKHHNSSHSFLNHLYSREEKNESFIDFPVTNLDMTNYVLGKTKSEPVYDLCGISQHYGGASFGHYTAACKNNGKWYSFNDSHVTRIKDEREIVNSAAYILFYKLKEYNE